MLRPDFLFCHRALWEKRVGVGVGRAEYDAPVELPCRAEIKRGCDGVTGRVFLPAGHAVSPGDRLTIGGERLFVKSAAAYPTHTECETA